MTLSIKTQTKRLRAKAARLQMEEHKEHATQFTLGEALAIVLSLRGPVAFKNDAEYSVVKI